MLSKSAGTGRRCFWRCSFAGIFVACYFFDQCATRALGLKHFLFVFDIYLRTIDREMAGHSHRFFIFNFNIRMRTISHEMARRSHRFYIFDFSSPMRMIGHEMARRSHRFFLVKLLLQSQKLFRFSSYITVLFIYYFVSIFIVCFFNRAFLYRFFLL